MTPVTACQGQTKPPPLTPISGQLDVTLEEPVFSDSEAEDDSDLAILETPRFGTFAGLAHRGNRSVEQHPLTPPAQQRGWAAIVILTDTRSDPKANVSCSASFPPNSGFDDSSILN